MWRLLFHFTPQTEFLCLHRLYMDAVHICMNEGLSSFAKQISNDERYFHREKAKDGLRDDAKTRDVASSSQAEKAADCLAARNCDKRSVLSDAIYPHNVMNVTSLFQ